MTFDLKRRLGKLELVIKPTRGPTPMQADHGAREFDAKMNKLRDAIRAELAEGGPEETIRRVTRLGSAAELLVLLDALSIPDDILAEYEINVSVSDWAGQDLPGWKARVRSFLREIVEGEPEPTANGHVTGGPA